jgi:hypothetical protein
MPKAATRAAPTLSRKAERVRGALAAFVSDKLAQDTKVDLRAVVMGTTALNYSLAKPIIAKRLALATDGKLAKDANLKDVHGLLDRLDGEGNDAEEPMEGAPDPEETTDNPSLDDDGMCEQVCTLLEGKIAPELLESVRAMMSGEGGEKDDDPAPPEAMPSEDELQGKSPEEMEAMKKKAQDAWKTAKPARDAMKARDKKATDKAAADKAAKDAKDAATRRAMDKEEGAKAMDSAIKAAISGERSRNAAIRDAEAFVAPWVGPMALPQNTAVAVYRLALDSLGVDASKVNEVEALKLLVKAQPLPGRGTPPRRTLAHDAAGPTGFAARFPEAGRLKAAV